MRSDLVFGAMTHVSNRFLLTGVAAKATRKLHRPNTRIEDTLNEVLERFAHANPLADALPADAPQPFPGAEQSEAQHVKERRGQSERWMAAKQDIDFDTKVIPPVERNAVYSLAGGIGAR
jgi:hypothetical protein